jgi:hypothetical protein
VRAIDVMTSGGPDSLQLVDIPRPELGLSRRLVLDATT